MKDPSRGNEIMAIPIAVLGLSVLIGMVIFFDYVQNGRHKESIHEEGTITPKNS